MMVPQSEPPAVVALPIHRILRTRDNPALDVLAPRRDPQRLGSIRREPLQLRGHAQPVIKIDRLGIPSTSTLFGSQLLAASMAAKASRKRCWSGAIVFRGIRAPLSSREGRCAG